MTIRFLDFSAVRRKEKNFADLLGGLTQNDLRDLTNSMVDAMLSHLEGCVDADVTFRPHDPNAHDAYTANPDEADQPWTLGHVIVHTTASAEETAFLAAELTRGVPNHGRSRYETPWQAVTTLEQCRQRLEESRRMRLASLDLWPDPPHLEVTHTPFQAMGPINAIAYFAFGLMHDDDHLGHIAEIAHQAKAARGGQA
ncbi:MAG TPA: DinB family protein [Chloroflexi bacterium]|nr:DinB family protein [Chloroflexota bacterium]